MSERIAVIDCGTNTFHLLIAEKENNLIKEIIKKRVYVYLAEQGISRIGDRAFQRGLTAIAEFKEMIDQHQVNSVKAMGTAALRTASNGKDFLDEVKNTTGIDIEIIDGHKEADLIYRGVAQAIPMNEDTVLIMDIGGGSVEYIFANKDGASWQKSFPIGISVLQQQFQQNDPLSNDEISSIEAYLARILQPLADEIVKQKALTLVGSSGTFDVLENAVGSKAEGSTFSEIRINDFQEFYKKIAQSSMSERLAMPEIPEQRAKLIPIALVLIEFTLRLSQVNKIMVSDYAMKQGMLAEMMELK
jgi:exopolyphosphatase / guanosine-5'-triphosphate,3'-diphosphate pyrophosphatase